MKKQLNQVLKFHQRFHSHWQDEPSSLIPEEVKQLRIRLINEETAELVEAIGQGSLKEIAKEMADVLYVVLGTVVAFGLQNQMGAIFDEVHQSNMAKMDGKGKFEMSGPQGKVLKGKNYQKPKLEVLDGFE